MKETLYHIIYFELKKVIEKKITYTRKILIMEINNEWSHGRPFSSWIVYFLFF